MITKNIDEIQMFLGYDYRISDKIVIHNPLLSEVIEYGEKDYFNMVYTICGIPSDFKSQLFDSGIDYEEISDFDLFTLLVSSVPADKTKILFGDNVDFTKFKRQVNPQNGENVFRDPENNITIDNFTYMKFIDFIRKLHSIKPKVEHAANAYTKKVLIEDDRMRIKMRKEKKQDSFLYNLIISMVNTEEFKYNSKEVFDMGLFEFMQSVNQVQKKKQALALMQGSFSGMVDMSKIDKKNLNWIKESD